MAKAMNMAPVKPSPAKVKMNNNVAKSYSELMKTPSAGKRPVKK